ncbi:hypothetical protein KIN20_008271 [Parelaphostrongylus tenuis]|uniref:Uncharacterized protein n=1 Tax=Parelaphostrongylus tenuis TaxID=148309 RepID=A0AAD5M4L5_PARTN|nr:hypothetical protein KIN20_008271 [Parelaphostrongylus tenuis]
MQPYFKDCAPTLTGYLRAQNICPSPVASSVRNGIFQLDRSLYKRVERVRNESHMQPSNGIRRSHEHVWLLHAAGHDSLKIVSKLPIL